MWRSKPYLAWQKYILPNTGRGSNWVEDSKPISPEINLSKRELFGLIIFSYISSRGNSPWNIGYDSSQPEPNDGFVQKGGKKVLVEHKLVSSWQKKEVLTAIGSTYKNAEGKKDGYGLNRSLLIQVEKESDVAPGAPIKISDFTHLVNNTESISFDSIYTFGLVKMMQGSPLKLVFHAHKHWPIKNKDRPLDGGIISIIFNWETGFCEEFHSTR